MKKFIYRKIYLYKRNEVQNVGIIVIIINVRNQEKRYFACDIPCRYRKSFNRFSFSATIHKTNANKVDEYEIDKHIGIIVIICSLLKILYTGGVERAFSYMVMFFLGSI